MMTPLMYRLRRCSAAHAAAPNYPIAHARAAGAPTGRLLRAELNVEVRRGGFDTIDVLCEVFVLQTRTL
jgi:hypothetical protein